jgi:hypothetical protein
VCLRCGKYATKSTRSFKRKCTFAQRLVRWLKNATSSFPGYDRLMFASQEFVRAGHLHFLETWAVYFRELADQQTKTAVQMVRQSWKNNRQLGVPNCTTRPSSFSGGKLSLSRNLCPLRPEGMSSAPCHVLAHHRKQRQHWLQATDQNDGYAQNLHLLLLSVPCSPVRTADQIRAAARGFAANTSAPDGLAPKACCPFGRVPRCPRQALCPLGCQLSRNTAHIVIIPKKDEDLRKIDLFWPILRVCMKVRVLEV